MKNEQKWSLSPKNESISSGPEEEKNIRTLGRTKLNRKTNSAE